MAGPVCGKMVSFGAYCDRIAQHTGPCEIQTGESMRAVVTEVAPGAANRDPHPERPPANFFSVDLESVEAIAMTHFEGDARYGMENWQKGLPASNLINHAWYHLLMLNSGDHSEPHLEHAIWNLGKLKWMTKHKPEMIDVPAYRRYFGLPPLETK